MTEVVDYIEAHISEEIDFAAVAKIVCCDVYQFGRIFSYVVGVSLAEYIRNRRLSLAAVALQAGAKVLDVALQFGYNSPEAFARAFREMHGTSPKESPGKDIKLYPRITFQIHIKGADNMDYRIEEKAGIPCVGRVYRQPKDAEKVTNVLEMYLDTADNAIRNDYKLYRAPLWQISLAQVLDDGQIETAIGAQSDGGNYPGLDLFEIPAGTWGIFAGKGRAMHTQDGKPCESPGSVSALLTRIISEWLPSSGYEMAAKQTVKIFPPGDAESEDYAFELWVPVKKK